jgi:hypothetical protein
VKDAMSPAAPSSRRTVTRMLGPLLILSVELGYSSLVCGKFLGRINVPGNPSGYVYCKIDALGACLFFGCVQLS